MLKNVHNFNVCASVIRAGTKEAQGVSEADMARRERVKFLIDKYFKCFLFFFSFFSFK
jgi:hypothetical protein